MCTEVKKDWSLNQGDFQSMVSGEDVSVAIKHEKARSIPWTVPGFLAGNEIGRWTDAAGSMRRRILPIEFNRVIPKDRSDPMLLEHIKKGIGAMLRKMNVAYLHLAHKHGRSDIWKGDVLPASIQQFATNMVMSVDALASFMDSRKRLGLRCGRDVHEDGVAPKEMIIKLAEFRSMYKAFRSENGFPTIQFTDDHFNLVSQEFGLAIAKGQQKMYGDMEEMSDWLVGIELIDGPVSSF